MSELIDPGSSQRIALADTSHPASQLAASSSPSPPPPSKKRKLESALDSSLFRKGRSKGKTRATAPTPAEEEEQPTMAGREALSEYTCPICFFPPSNATLTPCGHVCCGSCLFTAVRTTLQRGAVMGVAVNTGENVPRCPVCRAVIRHWDGRGGGVIGLKVKIWQ